MIRQIEDTMRDNAREWSTSPLNALRHAAPLVLVLCDELAAIRMSNAALLAACEQALAALDDHDHVRMAEARQALRAATAQARGE